MSQPLDRLYDLLPVVYRLRDAEEGYPLRALMRVINEQANIIEDDIAQLYENWFIETCEDWVVPYLGDLIGYRPVNEAGEAGAVVTTQSLQRGKILVPRREVAATIGNRRRKGTLALLELLSNEVAGWPVRAVEFYRLLGWTQHINHTHSLRGRTADLREGNALDLIDTAFDSSAHTVDVRRIASPHTPGNFNLPSVGVFAWRLKTYSVTDAPAHTLDEVGPHAYTFSTLGHDTPLYNCPRPETEPTHIAEESNLPVPIRRHALAETVVVDGKAHTQASSLYYGPGENKVAQSLVIRAADWPQKGTRQPTEPIPREAIIPADLKGWRYRAPRDHVLVDPERGRMIFPTGQLPKKGVRVSYHYGFSADIGGGEYDRQLTQPDPFTLYRVSKKASESEEKIFGTIQDALKQWDEEKRNARDDEGRLKKLRNAIIEIIDSDVYVERDAFQITLQQDESLQLRAANRTRPIIRMLDYTEGMDALSVSGKSGSRFTLDGLTVMGRGIQISKESEEAATTEQEKTNYERSATNEKDNGDLCVVTIRHCTLVPGWELECDCEPKHTEPSLFINYTSAHVRIEHSIVGAIRVEADEVKTGPVRLQISDSIVDATGNELAALASPTLPIAYARLNIARTTVIGEIYTHAIELAENCIFNGKVRVARRQQGCVRFSYVPTDSRTPRRYQCQPDLIIAAVKEKSVAAGIKDADEEMRETLRVRPQFNSTRYGTPIYCQLSETCADELRRGADDESEMGVFHDLYQPQRAANLRARLDEYTPAGMEAGIIYAS
jgi:septum formation topological specificity factor MinE